MSSYLRKTQHPTSLHFEDAEWLDDYFGQHNYGVRFPSDGKVFRADEFEWQENHMHLALEGTHRGGAMTVEETHKGSRWEHPMQEVEQHDDGKRTITTKHEDGRQDVQVEVTRLNIENRTPEDDIAEAKIIDALSKKEVFVTVLHKPTLQKAEFKSPLPEVRKRALAVIGVFNKALAEKLGVGCAEAPMSEFVVLQSDSEITVSTL
jgi:hypothetical protein